MLKNKVIDQYSLYLYLMMKLLRRPFFSNFVPNLMCSIETLQVTTDLRHASRLWGRRRFGECSWTDLHKQQRRGRESCVYLEGDSPKRNSSRSLGKDRSNTAVIWKEFPSCAKTAWIISLCNKFGSSGIRSFLATIIQMLLYPSLLLFSGCLLLG